MQYLPKSTYIPIPEILFSSWLKKLTLTEFKVLCCLIYASCNVQSDVLYSDYLHATISFNDICDDVCLCRKTVVLTINRLCDHKIITKQKNYTSNNSSSANTYIINLAQITQPITTSSYVSKLLDKIINLKKTLLK